MMQQGSHTDKSRIWSVRFTQMYLSKVSMIYFHSCSYSSNFHSDLLAWICNGRLKRVVIVVHATASCGATNGWRESGAAGSRLEPPLIELIVCVAGVP